MSVPYKEQQKDYGSIEPQEPVHDPTQDAYDKYIHQSSRGGGYGTIQSFYSSIAHYENDWADYRIFDISFKSSFSYSLFCES